jgi:hypothetical protein
MGVHQAARAWPLNSIVNTSVQIKLTGSSTPAQRLYLIMDLSLLFNQTKSYATTNEGIGGTMISVLHVSAGCLCRP